MREGSDLTPSPHARARAQHAERLDHGVGADLDIGVDHRGRGVLDADAVGQVLLEHAGLQSPAHLGQLDQRVDAAGLLGVLEGHIRYRTPGAGEEAHRVREVELALGVVVRELGQHLAQPLAGASKLVEAEDSAPQTGGQVTAEAGSNKSVAEYHAMVRRSQEYIVAGDIIQVVPSQRLEVPVESDAFDLYRSLRAVNPSPYMYFLHLDDFDIVGASPEMLVRVEDGLVDTHPIAGTRRRGIDAAEDKALEEELKADEKERAEHIMLLDLGRNDIGRVSKPGSVRVPQMLEVERYSHVMHLVSHVSGDLRDDMTCFDALRACFPAGTVSGAPKIRAMEIIAELEGERRGSYAGAVGYFSFSGNMDTAIAIRTMVVKDGIAYLQAGGGVVFDSEPEFERLESLQKAGALLRAIEEAERGRA